jgi:hypothetical protein
MHRTRRLPFLFRGGVNLPPPHPIGKEGANSSYEICSDNYVALLPLLLPPDIHILRSLRYSISEGETDRLEKQKRQLGKRLGIKQYSRSEQASYTPVSATSGLSYINSSTNILKTILS